MIESRDNQYHTNQRIIITGILGGVYFGILLVTGHLYYNFELIETDRTDVFLVTFVFFFFIFYLDWLKYVPLFLILQIFTHDSREEFRKTLKRVILLFIAIIPALVWVSFLFYLFWASKPLLLSPTLYSQKMTLFIINGIVHGLQFLVVFSVFRFIYFRLGKRSLITREFKTKKDKENSDHTDKKGNSNSPR